MSSTSGATHTPIALSRLAAERLEREGIANARLEAELLLAWVLGLPRLQLYLQYDRPLTEAEVARYREALRRRLRREPIQYITGEAAFRSLVLRVDRRVLIPRPETEVLVGEVLRWAAREGSGTLRAADVGTGSGAIAISLAAEGPFERVVATDISPGAIELARENAERAGVADRIELRQGSLWEALETGERFDVIVSNPPYVAEAERDALPPEVLEWEPATALFAAGGGLSVIDALVRGAAARLEDGGLLALEIGAGQAVAVTGLLGEAGCFKEPRIVCDLAGRERIVIATLADHG